MLDDAKKAVMPNSLILQDRHTLNVSGVSDVDSFDEQTVVAYTDYGELTVRGSELHISKLNIDDGELLVEGNIASLVYTDSAPKASGFFGRVFR